MKMDIAKICGVDFDSVPSTKQSARTCEAAKNDGAELSGADAAYQAVVGDSGDNADQVLQPPRSFAEIPPAPKEIDNPRALFENGWLRKGHFGMLVAGSGVGKSVISSQIAFAWSVGEPGILGIRPLRPLKIRYIGAEDDDEELDEFRRNMREGYRRAGWGEDRIALAEESLIDESSSFSGLRGDRFADQLRRLLEYRRDTDVVIMNPLQSYAGVNLARNDELSTFLRDKIDPIIKDPECGCMLWAVHHTNKPPSWQDRQAGWGTDAMAAYVGAGGAELVNYARAIVAILPYEKKGKDADGYFWLVGAKRGDRLKWKDADMKPTKKRLIAHSPDIIFWREPSASEIAAIGADAKPGPKINPTEAEQDAQTLFDKLLADRAVLKTDLRNYAAGFTDSQGGKHPGVFDCAARGIRAFEYLLQNLESFGLQMIDAGRNNASMIGQKSYLSAAVDQYLRGRYEKPLP